MKGQALTPRFLKLLPAIASFLLATAMFVQMQAWVVTDDASGFHESIRAAVGQIPVRVNDWEGTDIKVPAPAGELLRPNVLFARRYENERTDRSASLVFIHCKDSRDMSGHYPPNCYPASGWTAVGDRQESEVALTGRTIPAAVYEFRRNDLGNTRHSIVYNFFILPSGVVTRMSDVQDAGGDRRARPYGAAQVQVVMDAGTPEFARKQIVQELLQPLAPIIDKLQIRKEGTRP